MLVNGSEPSPVPFIPTLGLYLSSPRYETLTLMVPLVSAVILTGIIVPLAVMICVSWSSISTFMSPLVTRLSRSSVTFTLIVTLPVMLLATVTTVVVFNLSTSNSVSTVCEPTVP